MERLVTDLPEPDSPTTAKVSPRPIVEAYAIDGSDLGVLAVEMGPEIIDLEQRPGSRHDFSPRLHARLRLRREELACPSDHMSSMNDPRYGARNAHVQANARSDGQPLGLRVQERVNDLDGVRSGWNTSVAKLDAVDDARPAKRLFGHAGEPMMSGQRPAFLFFDGKIVPYAEAKVHVLSTVFKYAAGIFEGIRAYHNEQTDRLYIFRLKEHLDRLQELARSRAYRCPIRPRRSKTA